MQSRKRILIMTAVLLIAAALWLPGLRPKPVAAQGPVLAGSYGYTIYSPYAPSNPVHGAGIGVFTFDGAGNVSGNETAVTPDLSGAPGSSVRVQAGLLVGKYTVNADGTGGITFQDGTQVSFVMTDGGSQLMFVLSGGGNFLLTGTARKQ